MRDYASGEAKRPNPKLVACPGEESAKAYSTDAAIGQYRRSIF